MDFTKYHLKEKYRKVLDNLSDEDKIRTIFKRYRSLDSINNALAYYELKDHPLHKKLASNKFNDPEYAYYYSIKVIKGRWLEAEETIKTSPTYAYNYAKDVIKDRWLEAEETIKTSPTYAFYYAEDVIKDRWLEAEKVIKTDPQMAYYYAEDVIKDRWLEAEPFIKTNLVYWNYYKTHFNLQG